jgi:MFS family permease
VAMGTAAGHLSPAFGGWRGAMVGLGVCSLAMVLLWVLFYKEGGDDSAAMDQQQNLADNFKKVFKNREIIFMAAFWGFFMMAMMGLLTLLPVVLEERGIPRSGQLVSIMMGASVIFNIVGGMLSDKVGKRKPFLIYPALFAAICVPFFVVFSGGLLVIVLIIVGACIGTFAPIIFTIPVEMDQIGTELSGTAAGVILMLGNTGGFIGPALAGKLMDMTGTMWPGFIFIAAALFIAGICIFPVTETVKTNGCNVGKIGG